MRDVVVFRAEHGTLTPGWRQRATIVTHPLFADTTNNLLYGEALISAEYRLETDDLADAVNHINKVRNAAGLTAFASGDADDIRQQIRHERATEFFAEGRSWQNLRNHGIFPTRWNEEGRMLGVAMVRKRPPSAGALSLDKESHKS